VIKNKDGSAGDIVAVKILRPNITARMKDDMDVLRMVAGFAEKFVPDARRLGRSCHRMDRRHGHE